MPATRRASTALLALLERLARVADSSDACLIVLDALAAECDLQRTVILLRMADDFTAVGRGVSAERVAAFAAAAREPDSPIPTLLRASGPLAGSALASQLGFSQCQAFTVDTARPDSDGLVLVDDVVDGERAEVAAELLQRCGPALSRVVELDDRRQQRQNLDRQRTLLTTIVDALPDPVLLTNDANDIMLANRRANQLFSAGSDASEGRRRAVQINNLLFSSFLTQSVMDVRGAGRELNLVDPVDGSDLLFEVLSLPLHDAAADGATISILRNITDLRRAVNELEAQFQRSRVAEVNARRERDRLNFVLENVSDPILVTDDQSNIVLMNKEADRLFVVPQDADMGKPEWRTVRGNDTAFLTMISNFLLQSDLRRIEKLQFTDPDSSREFPAEVISSKILNPRGETTAIVSVVHDLTQVAENERLAAELQEFNDQLEARIRAATEELEERNRRLEWQSQELERASRLKSEFLANMSHELRTPINVMIGYTSLMRERIYGALTTQQEESLAKIYTTSQHLLELINDILDLSKIEAGKMPVHMEELNLATVVGEVSETVVPMLRSKPVRYRTDVEESLPPLITDRTKLKQVLLNLVTNAIKFTHEGEVAITARLADADTVRIVVSDTGIGIRPADQQTIFEDFRQADQSHTREYGGTGLGLSITRKLLGVLGGRIHVESEYGRGASFIINLPVHGEADEGSAAHA